MSTRASIVPVGIFTVAYLVLSAIFAAVRGNKEFTFYIVVMVILCGVVLLVHRSVGLSRGALWALSAWGLMHMAGGLLPVPETWPINGDQRVLYSWWIVPDLLKYDHVTHAFGFGVTTWVVWECLSAIGRNRGIQLQPTAGILLIVFAAGLGFGALNEIVEFFATLLLPETNVGGYMNTGWDLVSNAVGGVIACMLIVLTAKRG